MEVLETLKQHRSELQSQLTQVDKAIAILGGNGRGYGRRKVVRTNGNTGLRLRRQGRHHLTTAGRKKLSKLMKQRWAERRKKNRN